MKVPYKVSDTVAHCPECGCEDVKVQESKEVIATNGNKKLMEYICKKCGIRYIPAIESLFYDEQKSSPLIESWGNRVRQDEGNNEGRSWKKADSITIIIRDKK